jgi:hypothetical protein
MRKFINETLFWLHVVITVSGIFVGYIFSLPIVILLISLHRLHWYVLDDCVLTKLQKRLGGLPKEVSFMQHAIHRFMGKKISMQSATRVSYSFITTSVLISVLHTL